jgi:hypothetical protein
MVFVRRRGFPLLRGAVIGGAAYSLGRRSANNAQRAADQQAAIAESQAQQAQPVRQPVQQPAADDVAGKLAQLGQLARDGLLTPEQFEAAKQKLLA